MVVGTTAEPSKGASMTDFDSVAANDPVAAADMVAAGRIPGPGNIGKLGSTYPSYKPGDRVRLVKCNDPWTEIRPGTLGTVRNVDDAGTVHINWDDGSTLGMVFSDGDRIVPWLADWKCPGGRNVVDCECSDASGHVDECKFAGADES